MIPDERVERLAEKFANLYRAGIIYEECDDMARFVLERQERVSNKIQECLKECQVEGKKFREQGHNEEAIQELREALGYKTAYLIILKMFDEDVTEGEGK